jgi:putative transposase
MRTTARKPNRLKGFDYSQAGYYFVTICTSGGTEYLGKVEDHKMILNRYGDIAQEYWLLIPDHYEVVKIDEFVVMPNHIHGIIVIESREAILPETERCSVTTGKNYGLLSKVVKSYKEVVSKTVRRRLNDHTFRWQRSFYHHVIRGEIALSKIGEYIWSNPLKWHLDKQRAEGICM